MTKKPKKLTVDRDTHKLMRKVFGYDTTYELPTKSYKEYLAKLKEGGDKRDDR